MFADDLSWGGTWAGVWQGFGTSPYTAIDHTQNNKVLVIFCLDYNDSIAPPIDWQANIHDLTPGNVTQYAQFGGNYGHNITTVPWAFTSDPGVNPGHSVDLTPSVSAYTRYLEAAWLFTNILAAQKTNDLNSMIVSQVAAWDLFVEAGQLNDLQGNISATAGSYTFNDYEYSTNNYASAPTVNTMTGLKFQDAVDEALKAAQDSVLDQNWYGSAFAPQWQTVTGDPAWATNYGRPVQEFLTDGPPPSVPEPSPVILFGTALIGASLALRKRLRASIGS